MPDETTDVTRCACGCGEPAETGSRYAGTDEAERMRHRARAQYARRRAATDPERTNAAAADLLARLGLTDVPLTTVAERLAVLAGDLGGLAAHVAHRAGQLDETAVERRIELATEHATGRAQTAETHARELRDRLRILDDELRAALLAREQADHDADTLAARAEQADRAAADALRRAETAEHTTTATQAAAQRAALHAADEIHALERDHARALADLRAEHTATLNALHRDYADTLADVRTEHAAALAAERTNATEARVDAHARIARAEAHADAATTERARLAAEIDRLRRDLDHLRVTQPANAPADLDIPTSALTPDAQPIQPPAAPKRGRAQRPPTG